MSTQLADFCRAVRRCKHELIQELYGNDESALYYSVHYLDLRRQYLNPSVAELKNLQHGDPVPLLLSALPRYDPQLNDAVLKVIISFSSILEVLSMLQSQYDTQLCKIVLRLTQVQRTAPTGLANIFETGLLDVSAAAIRDSIMSINGHRTKLLSAFKEEALFSLRCVLHTARQIPSILKRLADEYDVAEFMEVMVSVVPPQMLDDIVSVMQLDGWTCPVTLVIATNDAAIEKQNLRAISVIDGGFVMRTILRCQRRYKLDPTNETSSCVHSLLLASHLTHLIDLNLWNDLRLYPVNELKTFAVALVDMVKCIDQSASVAEVNALLSRHNSMYLSKTLQVLCYLLSKRTDLFHSFLVKYIPVALLSCKTGHSDPFMLSLFGILEGSIRFVNYMGSVFTPEISPKLQTLVSPETFSLIRVRSVLFERMMQLDSEGKYVDNLTGCCIVTPGIVRHNGIVMWVDAYDFEACLYNKPENPYTREHLTPDEFLVMQREGRRDIRAYEADRRGFIHHSKTER